MKNFIKIIYIELCSFLIGLLFFIFNTFVNKIPFHYLRIIFYKAIVNIGKESSILMNVSIRGKNTIIDNNTIINSYCLLDGRAYSRIKTGNNVDIAPYVKIWSADHGPKSSNHNFRAKKVFVNDHCWIASGASILPGVILGEGTVVANSAVVTKSKKPYSIAAGVPAKKIGQRNKKLQYKNNWRSLFE